MKKILAYRVILYDKYYNRKDVTSYARGIIAILFTIITIILYLDFSNTIVVNKIKYLPQETKLMVIKDNNKFSKQKFVALLKRTKVKYPHIIYAQAYQESQFKSALFKVNNNMFGMKMPGRRITLAVGVNMNHAVYKTWEEGVLDYIIWQNEFTRHIKSEDEYIDHLKYYAEDPNYPNKIKKLSQKFKPLFK